MLSREIGSIDIGKLCEINEHLGIKQEKVDFFRPPAEYILHLASFYLKVDLVREDKLKVFPKMPKKDPNSFLFALAINGDGAPAIGMTILVSLLNVGERLPSSKEQFLLFGGNVEENSDAVIKFLKILVKDLKYLESKVFEIENGVNKVKVEFKNAELPNYMKMLSFLAGELPNSATYFTSFANVNQSEANDYKKTFGISPKHIWKPFAYPKRVEDATKVEAKRKLLEKEKCLESTKHKKLLAYSGKELKSRQFHFPLIEHYVDVTKAEPLHLKNNTIKEHFMVLFKIAMGQMSSGSGVKCFSEIPADSLFIKFVDFLRKEMGCNFLATKIKRWFNHNGGKYERICIWGFMYLKHFPSLIKMLFVNVTNKAIKKRLIEVHLQSVYLRKVLSYTVRITDFSVEDLNLMKKTAKDLLKICCMFDSKISPSLWTVCNASPVHAEICLSNYGFGLGCNTMEGRKQKHQMIAKYSENTTPQNR